MTAPTAPKHTPLTAEHQALGARMVDFAGWFMPIQYEGLIQEHLATRKAVGIFDVSHMGEIWVTGAQALETLQWLTTNDVSKLENGDAQYSLFPNAQGGIVDDLIVYCVEKNQRYLLCVNAANVEKDFTFVQANNRGAELVNDSAHWAQIAIQGPKAVELTERILKSNVAAIAAFKFRAESYQGHKCYLARTGYTGEDGFEIFLPNVVAVAFWRELLSQGADLGVKPIGLGARDTLRTEKKFCLYGHEIDDIANAYEAGLGWVVKPQAKDFLGKGEILAHKERGLKKKLVLFQMLEKGIPRAEYAIVGAGGENLGRVTSGTMSPSLQVGVGIAYVPPDLAHEGCEIFVDIRGRKVKAQVVSKAI